MSRRDSDLARRSAGHSPPPRLGFARLAPAASAGGRSRRPGVEPLLQTIQTVLLVAPVLLFSVIAHEVAHGYAALRQGDDTALRMGRLTWNPVRHIDPFMTIILPAILLYYSGGKMALGGAKPVPVDPSKYRELKRGDIIVSLAGVATNFLVALLCVGLIVVLGLLGRALPAALGTFGVVQAMMAIGVWVNMGLIAFNLIPIPPLDGSHVFKYLLPRGLSIRYERFGRYGIVLLVVMLWFGGFLLEWWMKPALIVAQLLLAPVGSFMLAPAEAWLR